MVRNNDRPVILIIGAGASGLISALAATEASTDVIIFDGNPEPGKKILATGNGRCNFTNTNCSPKDFVSSQSEFASEVYKAFSADDTIRFFKSLGVLPRIEDEGRVYPYSGQAAAIRAALVNSAEKRGVGIITNALVRGIKKNGDNTFSIVLEDFEEICGDAVIIATGGRAGLQYGSTGDGYGFAKKMGHSLISPQPALVPIISDERYFKELKGVRAKGKVVLLSGDDAIVGDEGEIQFTSSGLSGICIFNISRFIKRENTNYRVILDLAPDISELELAQFIDEQIAQTGEVVTSLTGIINIKLAPVVIMLAGAFSGVHLAKAIKCWTIPISGTKGWKEAQTTRGGIDTKGIDPLTMESQIVPGLYFAGEVIDVDGRCGGFNLQWAWSSGYVAGRAAADKTKSYYLPERIIE